MDEAGVRKVIAENNRDLIVQIKDLVNTSISDFKRSNESIASQQMSEIKRLKRDSVPHFNKKSNEEQYKANKAIKDAVEDAQIALERNDVEKIKQALDKDYYDHIFKGFGDTISDVGDDKNDSEKDSEDLSEPTQTKITKYTDSGSVKCHCLRKCSRGQNLWSTDLAETWHRSWLPWDISKANLAHFSDFKF